MWRIKKLRSYAKGRPLVPQDHNRRIKNFSWFLMSDVDTPVADISGKYGNNGDV